MVKYQFHLIGPASRYCQSGIENESEENALPPANSYVIKPFIIVNFALDFEQLPIQACISTPQLQLQMRSIRTPSRERSGAAAAPLSSTRLGYKSATLPAPATGGAIRRPLGPRAGNVLPQAVEATSKGESCTARAIVMLLFDELYDELTGLLAPWVSSALTALQRHLTSGFSALLQRCLRQQSHRASTFASLCASRRMLLTLQQYFTQPWA